MNRPFKRLGLLARLAIADLWHDRKVSLCIAASLVAVIAPLLLLFGLKHGVVGQLQAELLRDPRNLEIKLLSSGNYDEQWLNRLQQRPETGFALGMTRSLNTQADLIGSRGRFVDNAEILPTGPGDPLLAAQAMAILPGQVILSNAAAERLALVPGDTLRLAVQRRLDGAPERGETTLTLVAVLPAARFSRPAAFAHPDLLLQLEHFRDGFAISALGATRGQAEYQLAPRYARARLYARDIDSVAPLERWLNEQHIETGSRLADIDNVKAINHVLSVIFGVIAGAALLGCIASLIGAFLANIDRKRRSLALLRLMGFTAPAVAGYLVLQALLLAVVGYVGGLGFYFAGSEAFNHLLGGQRITGGFICQITPLHGLAALALALVVSALVALAGATRAIRIQPAESLREL
ncbi:MULTISPECIES: FtsX-like permease family protein [Pseudomonas]|uniref:Putative ABC transporter, permease protein n=1 Tax=Pseudomonas syringae pv. antirrhini TaxID=251702 RepID=A0A0P9M0G6_9PSED|nr:MULTISPECIES: FtsX-like permease family protein [Pseudomonas]KPW43047.1 putative ABC transporter, permease protein [Pseudomonas syringae pv. apii]KPW50391.1 putative ABC transporter, permease protein [Pseudomonas syringae pv. antirrhini]RMP45144.1 putative ABC transporter, permease protein [Pseudomonas syringae pv. antirrhini]WIN09701.1 FtsX-like permease family protein [Pseudomonas syringae pv. antirrhini str. 126]